MSCKKIKILVEDRYGTSIYWMKYNKKNGKFKDKAMDRLYIRKFDTFYKNGKRHGKCVMNDEIDPTEITYYNDDKIITIE